MASHRFTIDQQRDFHDLMAEARKSRGLTQTEVSERTGVSQSVVSTIERSPYANMSAVDLFKLCDFYGISPNHIASVLGFWQEEETALSGNPEVRSLIFRFQELYERLPVIFRPLAIALLETVVKEAEKENAPTR